ncbi:MAG: c-type cytochrome domain-containing protein, partial [Planctomycetota bacterium]
MSAFFRQVLPALLMVVCTAVPVSADDTAEALAFFERRIRPLLSERCYACHGAETAEAGLRLDVRSGWERGGQRGPAIVPGDPSVSLLMRMVQGKIDGLEMPPAEAGGRLSDSHIEDLARWIREGAADPRSGERVVTPIETAARIHWSFQPLAPPEIPAGQHPIDFLVQRRLAAAGMQ